MLRCHSGDTAWPSTPILDPSLRPAVIILPVSRMVYPWITSAGRLNNVNHYVDILSVNGGGANVPEYSVS